MSVSLTVTALLAAGCVALQSAGQVSLGRVSLGRAPTEQEPAVSDDALEKLIVDSLAPTEWQQRKEREATLFEVLQRGGDDWIPRIERIWDRAQELRASEGFRDESLELHVLTTLRRLQGRPDPFTVEATFVTEGPYVFPRLPVVGVRLLYTTGETETFLTRIGGDYRGGRLDRWDLMLTGEDGTPHPGVDGWSSIMGGGISSTARAEKGFVWGLESPSQNERYRLQRAKKPVPEIKHLPVPLPMVKYQRPRQLGKFTVRAAYHATEAIAGLDGHGRLIVHTSEPLAFEWKPRIIKLSEAEETRVRAVVNDYLKAKDVVVTSDHLPGYRGSKDPAAHPLDHLFAEGWNVVPFLADALLMGGTPHEQALLIAGLYSLTGLESPTGFRGHGVLGNHTFYRGRVPKGSGVSSTRATGTSKGKLIPDRQRAFREAWAGHREKIRVER